MIEWPENRPDQWETVHCARAMEELNDVAKEGVHVLRTIPPYAFVVAYDHVFETSIYALGMRHRIVSRREETPYLIMPIQVRILRLTSENPLDVMTKSVPRHAPPLGSTPIFCDETSQILLKEHIHYFTPMSQSYAVGAFSGGVADIYTVRPEETEEFYYF